MFIREGAIKIDALTVLRDEALRKAGLTPKQTEIACLVLKGLPNEQIMVITKLSIQTVKQHIAAIYRKCGVHSRTHLFYYVFPH